LSHTGDISLRCKNVAQDGHRHNVLPALKFLFAKIMGGIPMDRSLEEFINHENIKNFKKRLEAPADEGQRQTLLKLLAEEIAKSQQLRQSEAEPKAKGTREKGTRA
jgi:hypothetical protein